MEFARIEHIDPDAIGAPTPTGSIASCNHACTVLKLG